MSLSNPDELIAEDAEMRQILVKLTKAFMEDIRGLGLLIGKRKDVVLSPKWNEYTLTITTQNGNTMNRIIGLLQEATNQYAIQSSETTAECRVM